MSCEGEEEVREQRRRATHRLRSRSRSSTRPSSCASLSTFSPSSTSFCARNGLPVSARSPAQRERAERGSERTPLAHEPLERPSLHLGLARRRSERVELGLQADDVGLVPSGVEGGWERRAARRGRARGQSGCRAGRAARGRREDALSIICCAVVLRTIDREHARRRMRLVLGRAVEAGDLRTADRYVSVRRSVLQASYFAGLQKRERATHLVLKPPHLLLELERDLHLPRQLAHPPRARRP